MCPALKPPSSCCVLSRRAIATPRLPPPRRRLPSPNPSPLLSNENQHSFGIWNAGPSADGLPDPAGRLRAPRRAPLVRGRFLRHQRLLLLFSGGVSFGRPQARRKNQTDLIENIRKIIFGRGEWPQPPVNPAPFGTPPRERAGGVGGGRGAALKDEQKRLQN